MNRYRRVALVTAVVACACGCGKQQSKEAKTPMTEAQRDSAIAASKLPGAGVVGKALTAADSARARAQRENEAAGQ